MGCRDRVVFEWLEEGRLEVCREDYPLGQRVLEWSMSDFARQRDLEPKSEIRN